MDACTRIQYALAFFSLSFCALAVAQVQPPAEPVAGQPHLELGARECSFGELWQGEPASKEIAVKNTGGAPLEIDVKASCGCTMVTKPKSPLPAGESTSMTIAYHTAGRVGAIDKTVTITTNDSTQRSVTMKLTGNVKMLYETEPRSGLAFGDLWQSSHDTGNMVIVNKYTDKLHLKLKEGQDFGQFAVEFKELEPGMRYELSATPKPPLKVGAFHVDVALATDIARVPEIKLPINGQVQPPVAVRPARLVLSRNAPNETRHILKVVHAPDQPIEVTGVTSTVEAVKVELQSPVQAAGETSAAGDYQVVVTLPPGERLAEGATPRIEIATTSQAPEYQKLIVPIQLSGGPRTVRAPAAAEPVVPTAGPGRVEHAPAARPAPAGHRVPG